MTLPGTQRVPLPDRAIQFNGLAAVAMLCIAGRVMTLPYKPILEVTHGF